MVFLRLVFRSLMIHLDKVGAIEGLWGYRGWMTPLDKVKGRMIEGREGARGMEGRMVWMIHRRKW